MTSWMSRLTRSRWTVPWAAFNLILLCFLWKPSFEKCQEPHVYYRYVDATFSFIISIKVAKAFQLALNSFHRSLWFIMDVEYDSSSHFWDVLVERKDGSFVTCAYRKHSLEYTPIECFYFQIPEDKFNFYFCPSCVDNIFYLQARWRNGKHL